MAVVKFTLDGAEYEFDNAKLAMSEAEEIEKLTGMTVPEWGESMQRSGAAAMKVTIWLALGRANARPEGVKYSQFDFDLLAAMGSMSSDEPPVDPTPPGNRASRRKSKPTAP